MTVEGTAYKTLKTIQPNGWGNAVKWPAIVALIGGGAFGAYVGLNKLSSRFLQNVSVMNGAHGAAIRFGTALGMVSVPVLAFERASNEYVRAAEFSEAEDTARKRLETRKTAETEAKKAESDLSGEASTRASADETESSSSESVSEREDHTEELAGELAAPRQRIEVKNAEIVDLRERIAVNKSDEITAGQLADLRAQIQDKDAEIVRLQAAAAQPDRAADDDASAPLTGGPPPPPGGEPPPVPKRTEPLARIKQHLAESRKKVGTKSTAKEPTAKAGPDQGDLAKEALVNRAKLRKTAKRLRKPPTKPATQVDFRKALKRTGKKTDK